MRNLGICLAVVLSLLPQPGNAWNHGLFTGPACDITKNIVSDFGAVGSGLVNDTPAFVGTGSFQDWAVNTYQPANPGKTICLTIPAGTYAFGTFTGIPIFDSIKSLVVNGMGATLTNALNLTTSASTGAGGTVLTFSSVPAMVAANLVGKGVIDLNQASALIYNQQTSAGTLAGNNVLTFASLPAGIQVGATVADLTNPSAISGLAVSAVGSTTITLSGNVSSPGVSSGDTITFNQPLVVASATSTTITLAGGKVLSPGVGNGDTISIALGGEFLGTSGIQESSGNTDSAQLQAVSAGATSVTVQTLAQASRFTANTYALLSGVDMQGSGFPMNPYFWEWVFITNVNTSTGVITFQSPTRFAYETTWPHYNFGDAFHPDQGGPATLYQFPAGWDVTHYYNNFRIYMWAGGTLLNNNGRQIIWNNPTFVNWGPNISQMQNFVCNNCDMSNIARLETDKLWDTVTFNGGTVEGFFIQSGAATGTLNLNGTHVTSGGISGAPGYMNLTNMTSDNGIQLGAAGLGQTTNVSCTNSVLNTLQYNGSLDAHTSNGSVTMSSGILTVPALVESPLPWAVPGGQFQLVDTTTYGLPFSVSDISGSGGPPPTNTLVQTSFAGGFPASFTNHDTRTLAAKTINFSGCTGSTNAVDASQAGARNAKPLSYSNRIYTCTNNLATVRAANPGVPVIDFNSPPASEPIMAGSLVSMSIAVSTADTSGNATVNFHPMAQFDNYPTLNSSGATTSWGAIINLKTSGTRTYTAASSSWSGSKTGDTLPTIANPSYMTGAMGPTLSLDISGESAGQCPVATVTIQTN